MCLLPSSPLPTAPSAFPYRHLLGRELGRASGRGGQSRLVAVPRGRRQPWQDGRLRLTPSRLQHQHHLAPSLSFPSSPKAFLWPQPSPLATMGWQAGALIPAADEKAISRSRWSSHPSSPAALGMQRGSRLEGKSSPRLPRGSEPAGLPCIPAVVSGFGVQAPRAPPLSPHIPVGVSSAPPRSLPPVQQTVSHRRWFTPASPSASSASSKIPFWPVTAASRPRRLWG